jgi:hypothetical protein
MTDSYIEKQQFAAQEKARLEQEQQWQQQQQQQQQPVQQHVADVNEIIKQGNDRIGRCLFSGARLA